MTLTIDRVDVWRGIISDTPGALGKALEPLREAGANLEFVFARPLDANRAVFFVAPLSGAAQLRAAKSAGMVKWAGMPSVRLCAPNKVGLGVKITKALGDAGINISGLSGLSIGNRVKCYIALKESDVAKAMRVLKQAL